MIFSPLILLFSYFVFDLFDLQQLLEQHEKYKLFMEHSFDLSTMSEGNMALMEHYRESGFLSIINRTIAMSFPFPFIDYQNFMLFAVSFYQVIFLFYNFKLLSIDRKLVFILTYITIAIFIGNFAVFNRHILPLLIFLVLTEMLEYTKKQGRVK